MVNDVSEKKRKMMALYDEGARTERSPRSPRLQEMKKKKEQQERADARKPTSPSVPAKKEKKEKPRAKPSPVVEEEEQEEQEEDPAPTKKKKPKAAKPTPVVDEEDEREEDPPPKKKKSQVKPSTPVEKADESSKKSKREKVQSPRSPKVEKAEKAEKKKGATSDARQVLTTTGKDGKEVQVTIEGCDPQELTSFSELDLPANVKAAMAAQKLVNPTPVQRYSIPITMSGRDCVAIAETGSGKTLAFTLPCLLRHKKRKQSPACLVLAPTRELALQVLYGCSMGTLWVLYGYSTGTQQAFSGHSTGTTRELALQTHMVMTKVAVDWKIVCIFGGESRSDQIAKLRGETADAIVATPGRLVDLIGTLISIIGALVSIIGTLTVIVGIRTVVIRTLV
jgi:ATP-dependent RNA helicase DBP3